MVHTPKKETRRFIMFETLKEYLVKEFRLNPDDVTMDAELIGDLGINSLELADLVLLCEDNFGVTVSDDDIQKIRAAYLASFTNGDFIHLNEIVMGTLKNSTTMLNITSSILTLIKVLAV